jgi:hypothetical protein
MRDNVLTPDQAIVYLGLDQQRLQRPRESLRWLCRTGRLKYTKVGRYLRFRQAWLDELIERNAVQRQAPAAGAARDEAPRAVKAVRTRRRRSRPAQASPASGPR